MRRACRGWLGPYSADEWLRIAHSDEIIPCHLTIEEEGCLDGTKQCAGAATFRANLGKLPRDRLVAVGPADRERVFATNQQFREHHHDTPLANFLAAKRGATSDA